jgi:hypothetical protein
MRRVLSAAVAAAVVLLGVAPRALADDPPKPDAPAPKPGPVLDDAGLGLTVEGPSGWTLAKEKQAVSTWGKVATFTDPVTQSTIAVYARHATAISLPRLRAEVTKFFADDPSYKVLGTSDMPANGRRSLPGVVVDATQTRPAPPPPAGTPPPAVPPPPVTWHLAEGWFLGGELEFLVHAEARATLWSRLSPTFDALMQNVAIRSSGSAISPKGEGSFRDEAAGFACRYPAGYGVRVSAREFERVEFAPAGDGPVIAVFRMESDKDADAEAADLVAYYKGEEVGGEAETSPIPVSGLNGVRVAAKGRIGGRDAVDFVAVVKRDRDAFRLRVTSTPQNEAPAKAVFDAFVKSFVLTTVATGAAHEPK